MTSLVTFALLLLLVAMAESCVALAATVTLGRQGQLGAAVRAKAAVDELGGVLTAEQIAGLPQACRAALRAGERVRVATLADSPSGEEIRTAWVAIKNGAQQLATWTLPDAVADLDGCRRAGAKLCAALGGAPEGLRFRGGTCEVRCDTGQPEYVPVFRLDPGGAQ